MPSSTTSTRPNLKPMNTCSAWKSNSELVEITKRDLCYNFRNTHHLTILLDVRMYGAVFGEYASTIRETEHLQDQPKQVHRGVFLCFAANWALFQNSVPPGKPDTKTTETFDHDPTPDPTRTGNNTPFGHTLTPIYQAKAKEYQ